MNYVHVDDAKDQPGLRLALTMGVPGPWSQSAKYLFEYKQYPFIAVGQKGAQENLELFAWTGHRNAPVAVFEDDDVFASSRHLSGPYSFHKSGH